MPARISATGSLRTDTPGMAITDTAEIGLDRRGFRPEQLPFGNHHDIPAWSQRLVQPENISNQSFSPVSLDRRSEPPGGDDAESPVRKTVGEEQHRHITPSDARPPLLDALELRPVVDPLGGAKRSGSLPLRHGRFPGRSVSRVRAACVLWRGGASVRAGRSWCASEQGTRGCASGADCWADTFFSSSILEGTVRCGPRLFRSSPSDSP